MQAAIARALAYAPFADMLWVETSTPDLDEAQEFADAVHAKFPGKLLAYNCSPSFNWKRHLDDATIAEFQARALCCACVLGALLSRGLCPILDVTSRLLITLCSGNAFVACARVWRSCSCRCPCTGCVR